MMPVPKEPVSDRAPEAHRPSVATASNDLEWRVGIASTATVGVVLLAWALSVDFPRVTGGFFGDGSTYYSLAYSLAEDFDFEYRREDLVRVWREFQSGPEGIFLKRGRDVQGVGLTGDIPFVRIDSTADWDVGRLYYAKSFIFPLFVAPFIWLFGTNGFLVFHALLMTVCFVCAYAFLVARSGAVVSALFAGVFLLISAAPVYMVWLTPDFFNLAFVLIAYFFWSYKEVLAESNTACPGPWRRKWLMGARSDIVAVVLLGITTYSKPTLIPLVLPLLMLFAIRRQWRRGLIVGAVFGGVVAGLFAWNVAITGEWNYQGGDRRTFYGMMGGFPFQNERATFDAIGEGRATNRIPVEVLASSDAVFKVFRANLVYFLFGRNHGFVLYFFPAAVATVLFFLARGRRRTWQWLAFAGAAGAGLFLILYMPFTYSGGGGPIANRYYLGVYPVFLFLMPPLARLAPVVIAAGVSALFTVQLITNPFYVSLHPGEHPMRYPYRAFPVELTLANDLPINMIREKSRIALNGTPPVMAYFLDDNTYAREPGNAFWVRGESRAEVMLRAPVVPEVRDGQEVMRPLRIPRLELTLETGPVPNRITVDTGADRQVVDIPANDRRTIIVSMREGIPYRRDPWVPTNYVYSLSIDSETSFVPMFQSGGGDARFLGIFVRLLPLYE
jgi:hypothetical protein